MGMSASQARLIALTARMSDTEYEAQQVNQQRLTLANQMNAVYETMCNMDVPTPPSKLDPEFRTNVYKDKSGDIKIKLNNDGTASYYEHVTNGHIVTNKGAEKVSNVQDPKAYIGTTSYQKSDFEEYKIADYYELVTDKDAVTTMWDGFGDDDHDQIFVTGSYKEQKFNEDTTGQNEPVTITLSEPTPITKAIYDAQSSTLKIEYCTGTRKPAESDFQPGKTYQKAKGTDETISGDEAKRHNNAVSELANKRFVRQTGNGYELVKASEIKEGETVYECTDEASFEAALSNSGKTGLTVGGRAVISMEEAKKYEGTEAFDNALEGLQHKFPDTYKTDFSVLVKSDDKGNLVFAFAKTDDVDPNGEAGKDDQAIVYEYGTGSYDEKKGDIPKSDLKFDNNGNISSAKIGGNEVALTIDSEFDEEKYDAAFSKYNSDKAVYDQEQNRLNHQTSIYQRQDKMLELKLTRLDNERNALNTEIEAVKKVIQDAIDRGFKTFSG